MLAIGIIVGIVIGLLVFGWLVSGAVKDVIGRHLW